MSKTLKEINVVTGTYTNKDNQEKKRYQRIGSMIDTKNGPMLKIDVIPVVEGGWNGWCYLNDPKPQESQQPRQQRQSNNFDDMGDVPF